ncbi:VOC family protein [Pelagibius sp.]|uniref:VOC family protein n=1 Tax=Pelagibius sp. TaxID=1931238 RepID=UPI002615EB05|nr:VOC family protein [Pelagibius sp.]
MLSYIRVGANDTALSGRFYTAILTPLGYRKEEVPEGIEFTFPDRPGRSPGPAAVYVAKPYDGKEATVGNGSMTAFQAETQEMVRSLHAAGLQAGGSDEGAPGFRAEYSDRFYVGYLRDPLGNKVAIFSVNPAEGTRGR